MRFLRDFHHYKRSCIPESDRISKLEATVAELLIQSKLPDNSRESSVIFELKHSSNVTQFARLLARKRDLDLIACSAGALLHDIYVIIHGKYKNHAQLGGPIALELLESHQLLSNSIAEKVMPIVVDHSDKDIISDNPYSEFGKDVDVLDCFLYPNAIEFYLANKPLPQMYYYLKRAKKIWNDLNVPLDIELKLLDSYEKNWLSESSDVDTKELVSFLGPILSNAEYQKNKNLMIDKYSRPKNYISYPSFLITSNSGRLAMHYNKSEMKEFTANINQNTSDSLFPVHLIRKTYTHIEDRATTNIAMNFISALSEESKRCLGIMVWTNINVVEPIFDDAKGLKKIKELIGNDF